MMNASSNGDCGIILECYSLLFHVIRRREGSRKAQVEKHRKREALQKYTVKNTQ